MENILDLKKIQRICFYIYAVFFFLYNCADKGELTIHLKQKKDFQSKTAYTQGRYVFFDNKIFCFNRKGFDVLSKDGKVLNSIHKPGRAPDEFMQIAKLDFNPDKKEILIYDYDNRKLLIYDSENFDFIRSYNLADYFITDFYFAKVNNKDVIIFYGMQLKKEFYLLHMLDLNTKEITHIEESKISLKNQNDVWKYLGVSSLKKSEKELAKLYFRVNEVSKIYVLKIPNLDLEIFSSEMPVKKIYSSTTGSINDRWIFSCENKKYFSINLENMKCEEIFIEFDDMNEFDDYNDYVADKWPSVTLELPNEQDKTVICRDIKGINYIYGYEIEYK